MHYIVYVYSSKSNGENNFIFYRLGAIGNEAFVQQTSLRSLNMSHNVIANIDMTALKGLSQLQKMDLSYNKISRLSERLFSGIFIIKEKLGLFL
jgi:Leucine-rich repeat (LRR) protein